jgi:hypothetical protein
MSAAAKVQPIIIDLNGQREDGTLTYAGYTAEEAIKITVESDSPEALTWLRLWHRGDLMTMNSTPENF